MNGTVIDSLVVELGLDPTKFTKGQQQALDSARKLEQQQLAAAKNIEDSSTKAADALGALRSTSTLAFAAITGSAGFVAFAQQAIHAGAAVGRLSRNLGVSVETISKFQALAQVFGGTAEGMASSFIQLSDALSGWKIGDVRAIVADFRALGAAGGTVIDINKGVEQTFLDIATNLRTLHDQDPALAGYWQRRLGIDPGLFDAMIQKGESFNDLLKRMQTLTDAEADAAGRLERRWNTFTGNISRGAQGLILDMVDSDSKFNPFKNGSDAKDIETIKSWWNWLTGASPATASTRTSTSSGGSFASQADKEAFIRAEAAKRGINPNVAMAVARSEGFADFSGDNGTSFGAYQLHVTPGGRGKAVGDQFRASTGLDPSDPANERASIIFALEDAKAHGWSAYHGAARVGISDWQGIERGSASNSTTEINIAQVNVTAPQGAEPETFANRFSAAVKRQSYVAQANNGQN